MRSSLFLVAKSGTVDFDGSDTTESNHKETDSYDKDSSLSSDEDERSETESAESSKRSSLIKSYVQGTTV